MGADGEDKRLFLICSNCGWNASEEALEQRILAQLTDAKNPTMAADPSPPLAVAPPAAAHVAQATPAAPWIEEAAKAWARPAVQPAQSMPAP